MNIFFSSKEELCSSILKRDLIYRYIPEHKREEITDYAWEKGKNTADRIKARYPAARIEEILADCKISLRIRENGARQIFSEFYQNRKEIILNKNCIKDNFIVPDSDILLTEEFGVIRKLFLAHELFHYLECFDGEIGLTYAEYKVVVRKIWRFEHRVGIRMLSEIGAHSFTRHFIDLGELTAEYFDPEKGIIKGC